MNAIIYTTNTGSTERYARLLAQETGLPVYSLVEAKKRVFAGAEVIYLGWIMAGSIKGYAEAAKRYRVRAVCAVGMGQTGTQTDSVRKKTAVLANIPLFTLQGNFDVKKLHTGTSAEYLPDQRTSERKRTLLRRMEQLSADGLRPNRVRHEKRDGVVDWHCDRP